MVWASQLFGVGHTEFSYNTCNRHHRGGEAGAKTAAVACDGSLWYLAVLLVGLAVLRLLSSLVLFHVHAKDCCASDGCTLVHLSSSRRRRPRRPQPCYPCARPSVSLYSSSSSSSTFCSYSLLVVLVLLA